MVARVQGSKANFSARIEGGMVGQQAVAAGQSALSRRPSSQFGTTAAWLTTLTAPAGRQVASQPTAGRRQSAPGNLA